MPEFTSLRAIILAGGSGTRLWPLSRQQAPKQFLPLLGAESLLEATVRRLSPMIAPAQVTIVTNEETASGEGYRILEPYEKILEPVARNTAAAIGVAAIRCRLEGADPVMVVLPSDHLIRDIAAFHRALAVAVAAAEQGKLVTFGIHPTRAETGFGYIQSSGAGALRPVSAFHEKPDRETAERFVASGNYFWNSGMFVWRASSILRAIAATLPALARTLEAIDKDARATGNFDAAVKTHFASAPSISIDHGVLEHCAELAMVPGEFDWSDVGSWDAVYDVSEKDAANNAFQGNVVGIDCRNAFIRSEGRLVAAVDIDDVTVIETSDAVLVTRRGASQSVRKVVEELAARSAPQHMLHTTVQRPWGSYTVLEEGPRFKIKRIEVRPGGRLSLQSHQHRSEHWVVISGVATVTIDANRTQLSHNQSTFVPVGSKHRLENEGAETLCLIEVQAGDYVEEDDIQRYDDVYGRVVA